MGFHEHSSASFAWTAASFAGPDAYMVDIASDLAKAYAEVREGRGFVVIRGLPLDGSLEDFVQAVEHLGEHFGHLLSQNAQGETVGHVIDASGEDPTPRMYRSNLELRPHSDITAMIALACWQKSLSGGASVLVSGITVHDELRRCTPAALPPLYRGYHYHRLGEQGPEDEPTTPYRVPVFANRGGALSVRYQRAGIAAGHRERGVPLDEADIAALNAFDAVAKAPENRIAFYLERGDVLVVNNYTVMHARTAFQNDPAPGRERRLVRLWLDREGFRDVPPEFKLFPTNGVPPQPGAACTYDFRKLYAEDPIGTGGIPKVLS
ncbi:MAG: TauD/TfdA family dioxygenase [Betaproteobacteria bacterium]|nr:TauD/TfdA family dioxygenase [Betaproteobacteria bacterium]